MPGLDLGSALQPIARDVVQSVTIRSNLTPEVTIDPFAAPGGRADAGSGIGTAVLRLIQPEVIVQTAGGPVPVSPWGRPTGYGGLVAIGVVVVLGVLLYRLVR